MEEVADQLDALTERERQIARLICKGLANKAIADELAVREGTVKAHVHRIFAKLGIRHRAELIITFSNHIEP
jgi:DNA-binding NarL/FixJ family response regulator